MPTCIRRADAARPSPMQAARSAERGFTFAPRSAEHGFIASRRSAEHGFTLVELMVVITIIALMAGAVILTLPDPRARVAEDAERLAARASAVRDLAIVNAQPTALWVDASGYGFEQRRAAQWIEMNDRPFAPTRFREGNSAVVGDGARQRVTFDSVGLTDHAVTVPVIGNGQRISVRIEADGKVRVIG